LNFLQRLSFSAGDQAVQRGIDPDWITWAVREPELLEGDLRDPDVKHAFRRIPENDMRVLHVIYNERSEPRRVITAYFDRKRSNQ
jgi:hypothetical protein